MSPGSGPSGTKVTVDGSGYPAGQPVEIRWDSRTGAKLGEAVGPSFSVQVTIPPAAAGVHYVSAAVTGEHATHSEAAAPFKVTPPPSDPGQPPAPAETGKRITGTSAGETLIGTPFADVIRCGAGDDRVQARGGNDVIFCEAGDDRVRGGPGRDTITGGTGGDRLFGEAGNDRLSGGRGRDHLFGNGGRDVLLRDGIDLLSGGSGADRITHADDGHHHGGHDH